jgi:hypothetical protein
MDLLHEKRRALGVHKLYCSDSPDMTAANTAAAAQAKLSEEQLKWVKAVYAETAPSRAAAEKRAQQVSDTQLKAMRQQMDLTDEANKHWRDNFKGIETEIAQDALTYDTPERREQEAGQAMADVSSQAAIARETAAREAAARGVDPSSGNFSTIMARQGIGEAVAKAASGNAARKQVETLGAAKKADAAALGRGIASSQATTASLALNAGNSSAGNAAGANAAAMSGVPMMQQGYAGAQSGMAGAAGTHLGIANIQAQSDNSGLWGGLGSVAGSFLSNPALKISDRNAKTDITPVDQEEALQAVRDTEVSNWAYKEGLSADDGQRHVGPMAQDARREMGEAVAPGGKMIDVGNLAGVTLAAVQSLDKKLSRVAAAVGMDIKETPKRTGERAAAAAGVG